MKWTRQKVWFVTMLGLMIGLSAYYLLTEDTSTLQQATKSVNSPGEAIVQPAQEVSDQEVLQKLQAQEGSDFFIDWHLRERDQMAAQTERYMKIITDPQSSTQAVSAAMTEMKQLEDRNEQTTQLQEKLQQHFADVIVKQEDDRWQIIVRSNQLKREQAVQIVQLAMDELKITADRISVEYRE